MPSGFPTRLHMVPSLGRRPVTNNPAIRIAKDMDGFAGLQVAAGEGHIGIQRKIADRDCAGRIKRPDRQALHQVTAPRWVFAAMWRCHSHSSGTRISPAIRLSRIPSVGKPWLVTEIRRDMVPDNRIRVTSEIRAPCRSIY